MFQVSDINTWKVYQVARKTNISGGGGGGFAKKGGGGWTVCRFKGRVWRKRGGAVFEGARG